MWIWVGRWVRKQGQEKTARSAAEGVRMHWRDVALDVGLDPDMNVVLAESEKMLAVGISQELDEVFREEGTAWQYY
ncbi:hypothetical protein dsx2_1154 [Desulfovibrio sp. X2]|uniref:hypothetical protein n=1 Tax=Desulfovibrio sp. X2 TaxID=941449 RepID=UPI000358D73E|nr:hypothetical protein [Desulfovibrio sp. X2]EPR37211.1 hypothetical protein dsx2_1154 [Desulfovibrio sp. X2]